MKRTLLIIALFVLASFVYAKEVPSTNQGIANASPGDHIIRSSGERVFLRQADIDYARQRLGSPAAQNIQARADSSFKINSSLVFNIVFILIMLGIIAVASICFSNISAAIARNAKMDDRSAKKLGRSVGILVGLAVTIVIVAVLCKAAGVEFVPKFLTILNKF
ncbi:MAG: hypothetical protein LBI12_01105 [Treponema sp.]|jgi:hypothetical protein|nr:hypothetical protein [Treponema sp.]